MQMFSSLLHTLVLSLFPCIILIIFFSIKWVSFLHSNTKKNLPPSPRKLPIIGNLHQLGLCPNHNLQILSQKYGPLMLLHFGSMPTLVASSAEAAKEIMKTHDPSFCSRPTLTMPNILFYGSKGIAFSPYGEYWRQLKSIMVLKLLSNTRVKSYKKVREDEIEHMIRVLRESCGSTIDMGSMIISLTNNIICRVALGRKVDALKYTNLLRKLTDILVVFSVGTFIPWLSWVDRVTGLTGRAEDVAKEFDEFLEGVIEEHVNKNKGEDVESNEGEDFVDILLDLQKNGESDFILHRDSLKAIILEAFAAGTDTTSTTLEWVMSELIRNPRVMKKLQQEITEIAQGRSIISEEDLEKMPYLKAVIKESLRLHTPLPLLAPRELMQDVKLMGYDIVAGTQVIINAWALGRDPDLWEEANEFRPERFLNNSINYQSLRFEWLPFGAGRRSCPGIQFSVHVIELALANMVYTFDVELPNGSRKEELDMTEVVTVSLHRKYPLLVSLSPRF